MYDKKPAGSISLGHQLASHGSAPIQRLEIPLALSHFAAA